MWRSDLNGTWNRSPKLQDRMLMILDLSLQCLLMRNRDHSHPWTCRRNLFAIVNCWQQSLRKHIWTEVWVWLPNVISPIWRSVNTHAVKLNAWDAQRYDASLPKKPTGRNEADEERMKKRYPVNEEYNDRPINEPAIVVDRHGKILVWYLPGALSKIRQVWFQSRIPDMQRIELKAL